MAKDIESPSTAPSFPPSGTQALPTRRIRVIGVPLDMGASRRGVDMGPSAMRVAGLEARLEALGHQVTDGGNIHVEIAETQAFGNPMPAISSRLQRPAREPAMPSSRRLKTG